MQFYKESTKTRPLLFFESFIDNEVLKKYENLFYNVPENNSQISYREQGYISFYKDSYWADEPFIRIEIYFKEYLSRLLNLQVEKTISLLQLRSDELNYYNTNTDQFVTYQINKLKNIRQNADSILVCKELILKALVKIKNYLLNIGVDINKGQKTLKVKTNSPFFDPIIKLRGLKKIYDIAIDNRIIDEEKVSEDTFIKVFTSNSPEKTGEKIIFECSTIIATYFLNAIRVFFNNLSHSTIAQSKCFYSKKNGKPLNQNNLDKTKSIYTKRNIPKSDFLTIERDLQNIHHL